MPGLTPLGVVHTVISLVAVAAGALALLRYGQISPRRSLGRLYVAMTILTCLSGFGIYQHGGFGKPHVLGIVTLLVLAMGWAAGATKLFGPVSPYVETVSYSATFFFHMIPGITETSTRLPHASPLLDSADAPELQVATGVLGLLFLIGAGWQVVRLRSARRLIGF